MKVNSAGLFSLSDAAPAHPTGDEPLPAPTDAHPDAPVERAPRVRTTTLDRFNQEMAVLDHPLDEEVEFYDEPRPRRWRVPAIGFAIFALSCGGYLAAARHWRAPQAAMAAREPSARPPAMKVVPGAPAPALAAPASTPAAVPATEKPELAGADQPAPPSEPVAVADPKSRGHHHHHTRHASGHHHHGGHSHH